MLWWVYLSFIKEFMKLHCASGRFKYITWYSLVVKETIGTSIMVGFKCVLCKCKPSPSTLCVWEWLLPVMNELWWHQRVPAGTWRLKCSSSYIQE